jgi:hypothetical protein
VLLLLNVINLEESRTLPQALPMGLMICPMRVIIGSDRPIYNGCGNLILTLDQVEAIAG